MSDKLEIKFRKDMLSITKAAYANCHNYQDPATSKRAKKEFFNYCYDLYADCGAQAVPYDSTALDEFLRDLRRIRKYSANSVESNLRIQIQLDEWLDFDTSVGSLDRHDLWKNVFYHFKPPQTAVAKSADESELGVQKRLYIHVQEPVETNGIKLMEKLVPYLVSGELFNVKISGPADIDRFDQIVAYFYTSRGLSTCLNKLMEGKAELGDVTTPGVAPGVHELSFWKGMGYADDLSDVIQGGYSFGTYLSNALGSAYSKWKKKHPKGKGSFFTRDSTLYKDFLKCALEAFEEYNINPLSPQLIGRNMAHLYQAED